MEQIKLIALDLDGTLLNSDKQLTERSRRALDMAAEKGIHIVASTGRFYKGLPDAIRELPYLKYVITINGAAVIDLEQEKTIYEAVIPKETALAVMRLGDELRAGDHPLIYDCYMNSWGRITREFQEHVDDYVPDEFYRGMVRNLRAPVDELKAYVVSVPDEIQKMQYFLQKPEQKPELIQLLSQRFPELACSTSHPVNIEINAKAANKGDALRALAEYLDIPIEQTASFGDGTNDLSMIQAAGIGVAMANASPAVLEAADVVTASCDDDGVALQIEKWLNI